MFTSDSNGHVVFVFRANVPRSILFRAGEHTMFTHAALYCNDVLIIIKNQQSSVNGTSTAWRDKYPGSIRGPNIRNDIQKWSVNSASGDSEGDSFRSINISMWD